MKRWLLYFNYVIFSVIVGVLVVIMANYSNFLPKRLGKPGEYIQAALYGIGYGIILLGILKQKDEWFLYNDYPFKNFLMRFKFFQKKERLYKERKNKSKK